MQFNLKIIMIALCLVIGLGILVSLVLNHYIGGFIRHVEEEERETADENKSGKT